MQVDLWGAGENRGGQWEAKQAHGTIVGCSRELWGAGSQIRGSRKFQGDTGAPCCRPPGQGIGVPPLPAQPVSRALQQRGTGAARAGGVRGAGGGGRLHRVWLAAAGGGEVLGRAGRAGLYGARR